MSGTDGDGGVVEIEFRVTEEKYPLVAMPKRFDCQIHVQQIVPRGDGTYAVFYDVDGVRPEEIVDAANEVEGLTARTVNSRPDGGTVEVLVSKPDEHFVVALTDAGALPREIRSAEGVARIVAEVPATYDASEVVRQFLTIHPTVEVVAHRQKDHDVPMFTRREFRQAVDEQLTPRQQEVLRAAFRTGYYDWPRRTTGQELAADLDIAHATLSQHLRIAERKVFSLLFGDGE